MLSDRMLFDRVLILDWSAAGRPVRGANSIWLGEAAGAPVNLPTRHLAGLALDQTCREALRRGQRLLIGVDAALGHPAGLAQAITGRPDALALWDHLAAGHRDDAANRSNYRELAAGMNRRLGRPVFWGDGRRVPLADLPRRRPPDAGPASGPGAPAPAFPDPATPRTDPTPAPFPVPPYALPRHRVTEMPWRGDPGRGVTRPKSPFQLAGAGAVGAQSLTLIPWLNPLRRLPGLAVWPFQPWQEARIVLAEVYPAMIAHALRAGPRQSCADAAQVVGLARSLHHLDRNGGLAPLFVPDPRITDPAQEGQILGFGHETALRDAAARALHGGT